MKNGEVKFEYCRKGELSGYSCVDSPVSLFEPAADFDAGKAQICKVGSKITSAIAGEIFVKFGLRLKEESSIKNSIVIELSNSHLGYVPTPEAFGENCDLYEANVTYKSIIPEGGDIMVDKLLELGGKLL